MSVPCLRRNKVLATEPILKPLASQKAFKRSYQALGAYFNAY
jgi:hypothetical protein